MNRRYSVLSVALMITVLTIGLLFIVAGCAQTTPREEKAYEISPSQTVNQIILIPGNALRELVELSDKSFEKAMELFKKFGGVVMHMGAWGIKVEGISASRTISSEARGEGKADVSVIP